MTRRQINEIRREHRRLKQIRALTGRAVALCGILLLALLLFFGVRGIVRSAKGHRKAETAESTESVPFTSEEDHSGDTAIRRALSVNDTGEYGWNVDEKGWWYKNTDLSQFTSGWQTIDGQRYYFDDDGYLATGWQYIDDKDVFFKESGIQDPDAKLKRVALTFDDGPAPYTDRILDVLEQYNAKATFFVVGTQSEYFTSQLQREYDLGMEIGSHTYNHDTLYGASEDAITQTMNKNNETLQKLIGYTPEIMRPTGGGYDATVRATVGMPMIIWDVDTLDWYTKDPDQTYDTIMEQIKDGSVILMHDIWETTADAVERVVPALDAMGYKMVTVSELAKAYGYELEDGVPYYSFYPEDAAQGTSEETSEDTSEGAAEESAESTAEDAAEESSSES